MNYTQLNSFLKTNLHTLLTALAVVVAIVGGIVIRLTSEKPWTEKQLEYLEFPGELFLRALKGLIIPLIVSSIISALGNIESSVAKRIALRAVLYYLLTTCCCIGLGITLVLSIRPGVRVPRNESLESSSEPMQNVTTADTLMDLLRNLIPSNIVEATFRQYSSRTETKYIESTNILGLIVYSAFVGSFCGSLGPSGQPLVRFFTSLFEIVMKITRLVIWMTPIGIIFLVMPRIIKVEDVAEMLGSVGLYTITVLGGILIHGFIVLPLIYFILTKKTPFQHIAKMMPALMTALGTSSSSATMPITIRCLEQMGLNSQVVKFLVPIGATVNMDGTALYEAVAAIFIAQSRRISLSAVQVITVSITATAASIGAAGIPQAGLVTMVIVLNAVGLPAEDVSLIFVVDWFLDRFRTLINVLGDSFGASVIAQITRGETPTEFQMNNRGDSFFVEDSHMGRPANVWVNGDAALTVTSLGHTGPVGVHKIENSVTHDVHERSEQSFTSLGPEKTVIADSPKTVETLSPDKVRERRGEAEAK